MGFDVCGAAAVYVSIKPEWLLERFQQKTVVDLATYVKTKTSLMAVVQDIDVFASEYRCDAHSIMSDYEQEEEENYKQAKRRKLTTVLECDKLYLIVCSQCHSNYKGSEKTVVRKEFSLKKMQQSLGKLLQEQYLNDSTLELASFGCMSF